MMNTRCNAYLLMLVIGVGLFNLGCKRGEDDPFFTLLSRKSRITGVWTLEKGDWSVKHRSATDVDSTYTFSDGKVTLTAQGVKLDPYELDQTFQLNSDGDYEIYGERTFPANFNNATSPEYVIKRTQNGFWQFGSGNGDVPAKSELILQQALYQQTYAIGANVDVVDVDNPMTAFVYGLKKLTNDEMVLTYDEIYSDRFGRILRSGTLTYKKTKGQADI